MHVLFLEGNTAKTVILHSGRNIETKELNPIHIRHVYNLVWILNCVMGMKLEAFSCYLISASGT